MITLHWIELLFGAALCGGVGALAGVGVVFFAAYVRYVQDTGRYT